MYPNCVRTLRRLETEGKTEEAWSRRRRGFFLVGCTQLLLPIADTGWTSDSGLQVVLGQNSSQSASLDKVGPQSFRLVSLCHSAWEAIVALRLYTAKSKISSVLALLRSWVTQD